MLGNDGEITEAFKRKIIAFANIQGGDLYIEFEDDSTIAGLENTEKAPEYVSRILHDSIQQDIVVHTFLEVVKIEGKDVVKILVLRGIRYGTSVTNASEENIRQNKTRS